MRGYNPLEEERDTNSIDGVHQHVIKTMPKGECVVVSLSETMPKDLRLAIRDLAVGFAYVTLNREQVDELNDILLDMWEKMK